MRGLRDLRPETYGDRIAAVYDDLAGSAPAGAPEFLAEVAGAGPALELGAGTGRVAIPLAAAGVEVHGIDSSEAMVARLRAAAGGRVAATRADAATADLGPRFRLVYVVGNTVAAAGSAAAQRQWFACARRHLRPGGRMVVEAAMPAWGPPRAGGVAVNRVGPARVDAVAAGRAGRSGAALGHELVIAPDGVGLYPAQVRPAAPAELDLMAALAGLELVQRWGGWKREPLAPFSPAHVSVYGIAGAAG